MIYALLVALCIAVAGFLYYGIKSINTSQVNHEMQSALTDYAKRENDTNTIILNLRGRVEELIFQRSEAQKQVATLEQTLIEISAGKISESVAKISMHGNDWLTVEEAASILRVSPCTTRRWLRQGKLVGDRETSPRRQWRITGTSVMKQRCPAEPEAPAIHIHLGIPNER